jgi:hypothetical protein
MAVVGHELVNAPSRGDVLEALERSGWGAIVLPPSWYPEEVSGALLEQFAEHIEEFVRHGYDVVCIGDCEGLREPLIRLALGMPEVIPAEPGSELVEALTRRASKPVAR